jgi:phosphoenolpyruvate-protein kinase (PTS system EI component)
MRVVAHGVLVAGEPGAGIFSTVEAIEDVLELLQAADLDRRIIFIEQASVTNISPIISRVRGVISSAGGPTSHLAIVARGFQTTCVVAANMLVEPGELEGQEIAVAADGSVSLT